MTTLDFKTFKWMCEQRGIVVDEHAKATYSEGPNAIVDLGIPLTARLISHFVVFLTKSIPEGQRLYDFRGAILWIGEIGIWDLDSENSAKLMFESMRLDRQPIELARGQYYGADEFIPYHAALMLALIVGWDALVVLEECNYLIMISHDEYVRLLFRDQKLAEEVAAYLKVPDAFMLQSPPWNVAKKMPPTF